MELTSRESKASEVMEGVMPNYTAGTLATSNLPYPSDIPYSACAQYPSDITYPLAPPNPQPSAPPPKITSSSSLPLVTSIQPSAPPAQYASHQPSQDIICKDDHLVERDPPPYQSVVASESYKKAAPKYILDPDYIVAKVGESPVVHFTVTSSPPLAEDAKHMLYLADGTMATKRLKVDSDSITFRNVRVADTGTYTIKCQNEAGLVGSETMELEVTEQQHQSTATRSAVAISSSTSRESLQKKRKNCRICIVVSIVMSIFMVACYALPFFIIALIYLIKLGRSIQASNLDKADQHSCRIFAWLMVGWTMIMFLVPLYLVPVVFLSFFLT